MSPSSDSHLLAISVLAEDLSCGERRKVIYLCGSLSTDCSVDRVREALSFGVDHHGEPPLFIMSVLLLLGRNDILKKVYKVRGKEAESQIRTHGQTLPTFRVLIVTLSDEMDTDDVNQIKFLLSKTLTREKLDSSKTFLDVVIELEKLDSVSPERVDLLEKCLHHIGRLGLVKKVAAYKISAQTSDKHLPQQQSSRVEETRQVRPWNAAVTSGHNSSQQICRTLAIGQRQTHHFGTVQAPLPVSREPSSGVQLEQYSLMADPRGVCVIIDCVGKDGEMLEAAFKTLHFNVLLYQMLGADEIFKTLKDISKNRESLRGDAFICCIISRSTASDLLGTNTHGRGISMDFIRQLFLADVCPVLAGKPKLFFIQGYRVSEMARVEDEQGQLEEDGCQSSPTTHYIPKEADVLWSQSWTDEYQLQKEQHRSVYLETLIDALRKAQRKMNLLDVVMEVNGAIFDHNEKNPEAIYSCDVRHTLRKKLYLQ
ncbi:CASP8 and FADD-like apoptosis regulator [Cyprinodon tularosa]|uniref:CASP8 and FADD-like apoptosis regulator n=1 Tax=Cyprinodon tularosa TaxID=77115 RepID=UPI0018E1F6E0|nr:CASP8 and FADD-like apoptosis regulator [Cyprinodon tularosa]